jgi:aliphatic nitrilase
VAAWPGISALTHDPHSGFFNDVTEAAARHHALAGQTFVINVQSRIDADTIARLGLTGRPEMMREGGGWSAIIAPNGQLITGPHTEDETILYADLDLGQIVLAKYACDSAGHYARPDVLRLWLNDERQQVRSQQPPPSLREPAVLATEVASSVERSSQPTVAES